MTGCVITLLGKNISAKVYTSLLAELIMAVPSLADDLKIGAASVNITPPLGTPIAGYYSKRVAQKIHGDLFAKTLVVEKKALFWPGRLSRLMPA